MSKKMFDSMTRQYSLSKTLQFELIPQGRSIETIKKNEIIFRDVDGAISGIDFERSEQYKILKKLLDGMHRCFFDDALDIEWMKDRMISVGDGENAEKVSLRQMLKKELADFNKEEKLTSPALSIIFDLTMERWCEVYNIEIKRFLEQEIIELTNLASIKPNRTDYYTKIANRLQGKLKRIPKIVEKLKNAQAMYKNNEPPIELLEWIIRKGRIDETLHTIYGDDIPTEELRRKALRDTLPAFDKFSSYFTGFNDNRANVYALKNAKHTSVLYRLYEDNLKRFNGNAKILNAVLAKTDEVKKNKPEISIPLDGLDDALNSCNCTKETLLETEGFLEFMNQKGIDAYNRILGGGTAEVCKEREKGVNQLIKETRDAVGGTPRDYPLLKPLYKQILSLREKGYIDAYSTDEELLTDIDGLATSFAETSGKQVEAIVEFLDSLKDDDFQSLYIGKKQISALSTSLFGGEQWFLLNSRNDSSEKEKAAPKESISWSRADVLAKDTSKDDFRPEEQCLQGDGNLVAAFFTSQLQGKALAAGMAANELEKSGVLKLKSLDKNRSDSSQVGSVQVKLIKDYLDARNWLAGFIKDIASVEAKGPSDVAVKWNTLVGSVVDDIGIFATYNKVRNYLTQKEYSTGKIKVNFDNATLLDGWDQNKETNNYGILFERNGIYYLGILDPKHKNVFDYSEKDKDSKKTLEAKAELRKQVMASEGEASYRKMVYKLLPDPMKMLPKVVFGKCNSRIFEPPEEIVKIKTEKTFSTNKDAMAKYINFYREALPKYPGWNCYGFTRETFKDGSEYESMDEFYKAVEDIGYQVKFDSIKASYIDQLVADSKLYLFKIYNKDFSEHRNMSHRSEKERHDNLHTSYWKNMFTPENLTSPVIKLNGQAEVFFRPASIDYSDDKRAEGFHAEMLKDKFGYPILKNKRFSSDKFFFHCPLKLNCKAQPKPKSNKPLNEKINSLIKANNGCNVIGIDRGEKHLLYYCVVDPHGNILEQNSFNTIANGFIRGGETTEQVVDYHGKLDAIEQRRKEARLGWTAIEKIAEMKAGYLSQVVHKLAELIVKYDAIVVLEDLNLGFKRGRFGIEKQVYQKFEVALMSKLSYLVFKSTPPVAPGYFTNAYQLAMPAASLEKMYQNGIVYYTVAAYTSKTDPVSGWMKDIYQTYESVEKAVAFWDSFESIKYSKATNRFEFTYLNSRIKTKHFGGEEDKTKEDHRQWTTCSCVDRAHKDGRLYTVTDEIKALLSESGFGIDFSTDRNIQSWLVTQTSKELHKGLHEKMMRYFNAMLNMRVTDAAAEKGTDSNDFIQSPIQPFFDSRKGYTGLPGNGDANGAYNIARKGLCMARKICEGSEKTTVDKASWIAYAQNPDMVKTQTAKMQK